MTRFIVHNYLPARTRDVGPSEEERRHNQREVFGFVPSRPGSTGTTTFQRPSGKGREEMVPTGTGRSIPKSKVNPTTRKLLGWDAAGHEKQQRAAKVIVEAYDRKQLSRTKAFSQLQNLGYGTAEIRSMLGDTNDAVA